MPWKPLQLSPSAGAHLPVLLISTVFSSSSYTIHLTDLTHIWSESLSKQDIIRRSRAENTSIDPSNADQFQIFIQKIRFGLEGGKDSSLSLTINSDLDRPSLVLHAIVDLPGGLEPLEWPFRLSPGPQQLLTNQLTVPLLRVQHERLQELAALAEVIKEKDHVIQKLVDKLEEQGTDLGQVFPQVSGKPGRKVDRKRAEERVKGLGPFDVKSWKSGLRNHEATPNIAELLDEVFQDSTRQVEEEEEPGLDNWWDDLGGISVNLMTGKISTKGVPRDRKSPVKAPPPLPVQDSIDENDDFQVQATPPRLSKIALVEESTDDDDDLDAPSQRSKIPDSFPISQHAAQLSPPAKTTRKLGTIGKKKRKTPEPESEPEPGPKPKVTKKLGTIGRRKQKTPEPEPEPEPMLDDETTTEDEPAISPPKRTPTPPPPKPKNGLGRIGGKKKTPPPESEAETASESGSEPPVSSPKPDPKPVPTRGKLGKIGGKKAQPAPVPPQTEVEPDIQHHPKHKIGTIGHKRETPPPPSPVQPQRKEPTPEPEAEETAEERANRKREILKKELEEKAKAPVKKRRKF